ncbi:hypothetical protein M5E89_05675 [Acidaminococcus intestini]|nr:hypothetical protein M5E89_05675 [Acidaminococcus intestini]
MRKERKEALESFLVRLGVTMQDLSLMDTALTHSSYAYECKEKVVPEFNQRLEFLGDSVLSLVVSTHLYLAYPEMDEGALSKFRAFLVCEETLAELAQDLAIGDYLLLGRGNVTWVAVTILPSWQMPLNPLWERTTLMQDMKR